MVLARLPGTISLCIGSLEQTAGSTVRSPQTSCANGSPKAGSTRKPRRWSKATALWKPLIEYLEFAPLLARMAPPLARAGADFHRPDSPDQFDGDGGPGHGHPFDDLRDVLLPRVAVQCAGDRLLAGCPGPDQERPAVAAGPAPGHRGPGALALELCPGRIHAHARPRAEHVRRHAQDPEAVACPLGNSI